jgi:hypothetical protein
MSGKWPSEARVQVSNLLNRVIMCDLDFSFYAVDDLALMASDLLDQFRKRGMPDAIQRKVLDKIYEPKDLAKIKDLVARFEAAIQTHDAEVATAQAALSAHASQADGMHAPFSASPSFSTAIPSSGATNGNPNGTEANTNANSQPGAVPGASRCTAPVAYYVAST